MSWSSIAQFLRTAKIHTAIGWPCVVLALASTGVASTYPSARGLQSTAATERSVTLEWTAVGDDGHNGAAAAYDVRYATFPITEENFESATRVADLPAPRPAGADELIEINGLEPATRYYFAIKASDDAGNWSPMSNVIIRLTDSDLPRIANFEAESGPGGLSARTETESTAASSAADTEESADRLPGEFSLSQNYPNPFNPVTTIKYTLPQRARVTVSVYNELGQRVIKLFDGEQAPGDHQVEWNGTDRSGRAVASGVYFYRVVAGGKLKSRKMILLK